MTALAGLLAFFAASLFAGAALYISIAEHPARMKLEDDAAALAQWKPSYARGKAMQGALALIGSLLAFWAWWEGGDWLWLAGGVFLLINWPYTLLVIMPVNRRLEAIAPEEAGTESRTLLARWGRLHAMRSLFGTAAALMMLLALAAAPLLVTRLAADPGATMNDCCLQRPAPAGH